MVSRVWVRGQTAQQKRRNPNRLFAAEECDFDCAFNLRALVPPTKAAHRNRVGPFLPGHRPAGTHSRKRSTQKRRWPEKSLGSSRPPGCALKSHFSDAAAHGWRWNVGVFDDALAVRQSFTSIKLNEGLAPSSWQTCLANMPGKQRNMPTTSVGMVLGWLTRLRFGLVSTRPHASVLRRKPKRLRPSGL